MGGARGVVARGERARLARDPEPGRSLGAGVRSRLADVAADAAELSQQVAALLQDRERCRAIGANARAALDENRGTTDRLAARLGAAISELLRQ